MSSIAFSLKYSEYILLQRNICSSGRVLWSLYTRRSVQTASHTLLDTLPLNINSEESGTPGLAAVLHDKHKLWSLQMGLPLRELQCSLKGSALGSLKTGHFLFLQIKNI